MDAQYENQGFHGFTTEPDLLVAVAKMQEAQVWSVVKAVPLVIATTNGQTLA